MWHVRMRKCITSPKALTNGRKRKILTFRKNFPPGAWSHVVRPGAAEVLAEGLTASRPLAPSGTTQQSSSTGTGAVAPTKRPFSVRGSPI